MVNPWLTIETGKDYLRFLVELLTGRRQKAEQQAAAVRAADVAAYLDLSTPRTILDIGSGSLRPQIYILAGQGHDAVGIDFVNEPVLSVKSILYKLARFLYRSGIQRDCDREPSLIFGDAGKIPLGNSTVDLATSMAAFEHFLDVPRVLDELQRVIRPGGILWIQYHSFTSLSGGHNVSCRLGELNSLPSGVEPWDHLRGRKIPFTVPLNEWRIAQYLDAISARFELISHRPSGTEGKSLLTQEIRAELSNYSENELLSVGYYIVARRRM